MFYVLLKPTSILYITDGQACRDTHHVSTIYSAMSRVLMSAVCEPQSGAGCNFSLMEAE